MKKIQIQTVIILFLILLAGASVKARTYAPLKQNWEWPIMADVIYSFDLDLDGIPEIYTGTYSDDQGIIVGLNSSGHLILNHWTVEGYLGQSDYKRPEKVKFIFLGDAENNGVLDILAGTSIKGGQVNIDLLYRFERGLEPGLFVKNIRKWYFQEAQMMTAGVEIDTDGDTIKDYFFSSLDGNIYVLSPERIVKGKIEFPGSVWDLERWDLDADGKEDELIAGYFSGISAVSGNERVWSYETDKRVFDVEVFYQLKDTYIIGLTENKLICLNSGGEKMWEKEIKSVEPLALAAFDLDADNEDEILVLTSSGEIHAFEAENATPKWIFYLPSPANIIHANDDMVLVSGSKFYSFSLNEDYRKNEIGLRYLTDAKENYAKEDCIYALPLAERAKELFTEVNNPEALIECDNIIIHCSPSSAQVAEITLANEYFTRGEALYNEGELASAKPYLEKALELYGKWNYRRETLATDTLLQKIYKVLILEGESAAREEYLKSVNALTADDLDSAKLHANKALKIYQDIESTEGIKKANELLSEISKRKNVIIAETYLTNAKKSVTAGNYQNASYYANAAKVLYTSLGDGPNAKECDEIISLSEDYALAESYYLSAVSFYNQTKYENSTELAIKAKELFTKLNATAGIEKTETLFSQLKAKEPNNMLTYGLLLLGIFILVVFAVILQKRNSGR